MMVDKTMTMMMMATNSVSSMTHFNSSKPHLKIQAMSLRSAGMVQSKSSSIIIKQKAGLQEITFFPFFQNPMEHLIQI